MGGYGFLLSATLSPWGRWKNALRRRWRWARFYGRRAWWWARGFKA
jgi:hypothetical protein